MTFDEFRTHMEQYRATADAEAVAFKDSQLALERLRVMYVNLDAEERGLADQVLTEWALSADEKVRFDALALIDEFRVVAALPALRVLGARLVHVSSPGASFELAKVSRIIQRLS